MSLIGVVLDTAVLYPPSLRDILLICATNELYKPYWSDDILIELERNLLEDNQLSQKQVTRLISLLKNEDIFGDALVAQTQYSSLVAAMTNHPKDRHVLAAAVISGANLIVTSNIKDFPEDALKPYNIEVETPDEFLSELFETNLNVIITIIGYLSLSRKNPPQTVKQILEQLKVFTPEFVTKIEEYLAKAGTRRKNR